MKILNGDMKPGDKIIEQDVDYRITCNNGNQRTLINP